jgi:hypothetical protein
VLPPDHTSALPAWITPALIEQARLAWQPYYGRLLSEAEAIDVLLSMGALCDVLFFDSPLDNAADPEPPAMKTRRSA